MVTVDNFDGRGEKVGGIEGDRRGGGGETWREGGEGIEERTRGNEEGRRRGKGRGRARGGDKVKLLALL